MNFRNKKFKLFFDITISLVLTAFIFSGYYFYNIYSDIEQAEEEFLYNISDEKDKYKQMLSNSTMSSSIVKDKNIDKELIKDKTSDDIYFLLLGIDARGSEQSRSDAILLSRFNKKENKLYLLSIPRDSYLNIPGRGYDKVNHAHAFGGAALTSVTLENAFQIEFEKYITINFQGFRTLVDELGGLQVNAQENLIDSSIQIYKGNQLMDGDTTLNYARFRHNSQGDYGRMQRQQEVITLLSDKFKTPSIVNKIPSLVDILGTNMKTDFTLDEMQSYVAHLIKNPDLQIEMESLTATGTYINGIYYGKLSDEMMQKGYDFLTQ